MNSKKYLQSLLLLLVVVLLSSSKKSIINRAKNHVSYRTGLEPLRDFHLTGSPRIRKDIPIEAFSELCRRYDTYILSSAPWENPSAWSDKLEWVKRHLGDHSRKRLILSHNKNLNAGHYLIDDRKKNGADKFRGELIQFGTDEFPDWNAVLSYLI